MKNLTLSNIASACGGRLFCKENGLLNKEVSSIVSDNRQVTDDAMFVAIKGNRVDGHDFIENAYESGALCVLSEKNLDTDKPYILVESSLEAIKKIAEFYREGLDIKVVGITGSVGKTSTKEMIYSVLAEKYNTLKTEGNFNNELGLPLTVFRIRDEHEIAVLEMGISDFGEMSRLAKIAKPDIGVITNIGLCHLENLKSRDGILKAKTEMLDYIKKGGCVVLNGNDDKLSEIKPEGEMKYVLFYADSTNSPIDALVYADKVESVGIKGTKCSLHYYDSEFEVFIHIPGKHMIYNALAALCVGKEFGLTNEEIKRGIEKIRPVSGRTNIIETDDLTIIDDCYNANPVSMKASIDVLGYADGRKVAILGDMFELGENEEKLHAEIGKYLVDSNADVIVLCGKLMNNAYMELISDENKNKCENKIIYFFEKVSDFYTELCRILKEEDTVLVKASHGMNFVKIIDILKDINL